MTKPPHSPQAEQLADAILRAAGSGLRHYTMHSIREGILDAAQKGIDAAATNPVDADIVRIAKKMRQQLRGISARLGDTDLLYYARELDEALEPRQAASAMEDRNHA